MTNARKSREDRAAKIEQMRREEASRNRRKRIAIVAGSAVAVLAVAGGATALVLSEQEPAVDMSAVKSFEKLTSDHVETPVKYEQTPPVGGNHSSVWQNCGVYTEPVANENAVHSMEHGAVWITHRPDLPGEAREQLADLAKGESYVLVSPFPDLPAPIVASAWGKQLTLESATDPRLEEFLDEYLQGPQTPEPGAACSGGLGTPQD